MTGVSTLGQALNRINLIGNQTTLLNSLTTQLATGKKSQSFSGLGTAGLTSQRARASLTSITAYTDNISNADRRMSLMLQGVEEYKAQAQTLWDLMIGFGQESLHDNKADVVYGLQTVTGTQDLSAFASIGALVAANTPNLDDPNDSFEITFSDPNEPTIAATITVDLSDAALAAGGGNAAVELAAYINNQLAAIPGGAPASLNASATVGGGGQLALRGTANIAVSNDSISNAISPTGLINLGLGANTSFLGPEHEIGVNSGKLDAEFATIQNSASDLYDFLVDLLNVQDEGRYLLGGADTTTKPLNDTGALSSKISTLLGNWQDETLPPATNLSNTELISAYQSRTFSQDVNAITDTTIGYSSALSSGNAGKVFVRVRESSELDYTVLANEEAFRDILVATAFIKNGDFAPIADVYADPYTPGDLPIENGAPGATLSEMKDNFFAVFNDLATTINNSIDDLDQARFRIESDRARIDQIKQAYAQEKFLFDKTVADVEDADLNQVAIEIQTLQIQLEASYMITARVSELTLVNFI